MIFYNWAKLYRKTEGNSSAIISVIAFITFPTLPINRYDPTYRWSQEDWSGDSFILHPEKILSNRSKFKDHELAQYVALASFRSYAHFKVTGKTTLSTYISPIDMNLLNSNRLLHIHGEEIFFCWEEVTH